MGHNQISVNFHPRELYDSSFYASRRDKRNGIKKVEKSLHFTLIQGTFPFSILQNRQNPHLRIDLAKNWMNYSSIFCCDSESPAGVLVPHKRRTFYAAAHLVKNSCQNGTFSIVQNAENPEQLFQFRAYWNMTHIGFVELENAHLFVFRTCR